MVHARTQVICRLSSIAIISMHLVPFFSIVQLLHGTNLNAVWSQFIINSGGISSIDTTDITSIRKESLISSKLPGNIFALVLPLCLVYPNCHKNCFPHPLINVIDPPNSLRDVRSYFSNTLLARPTTTCDPTGEPLDCKLATKFSKILSSFSPKRDGLPHFLVGISLTIMDSPTLAIFSLASSSCLYIFSQSLTLILF